MVGRRPLSHDHWHGCQCQDIVDDSGLTEKPLQCWNWWLGSYHPTFTLKAFEHRGFFTANVGAGTNSYRNIKGLTATKYVGAEHPVFTRVQ